MIKERIVTLCFVLTGVLSMYGEEVSLYVQDNENGHENNNYEIPIRVDLDQSSKLLRVDFKKCIDCTVIVSGADGIVYQQSISAKNYQSVRLDLKPYEEGDYEIVFYDTEGNVIDGSFYLKNKNSNYRF